MKNIDDQILDDFEIETSFKSTTASQIGKWCAISSFAVGTALFFLGLYDFNAYLPLGMSFIIFAALINILILIILLFVGKTPDEKHVNEKMALKMWINIPIAFVYLVILLRTVD